MSVPTRTSLIKTCSPITQYIRSPRRPIEFFHRCRFSTAVQSSAKKVFQPRMPIKSVPVKPTDYESTASRLAKKPYPTLLYQSSSHLPYILGCYFIGGGLIAMGAFNGYTTFLVPESEIEPNKKFPSYVRIFVNIGAVFMIAVGGYMCLRVRQLSIERQLLLTNQYSRKI